MSKDYRDGYKDGFKDGYEQGKRDAAPPYNPLNPWPGVLGNPPSACPVCGRSYNSVDMYVCPNPNCPSKITCTKTVPNTTPGVKYEWDPRKGLCGTASGITANNTWVAINGGEWSAAPSLDAEQQSPSMRMDGWSNK